MSANKDKSGTSLQVTLFVPWKPKSPNQLLHKHWSVVMKNSKAAKAAWLLASSGYLNALWTATIFAEPVNHCEMESQAASVLMMETSASDGSTASAKPKDKRV